MTAPIAGQDIYATLTGNVDQGMAQRVAAGLALASANKVASLHVLFHSAGGGVTDGIFLYSLFRAATFDVVLYNGGMVHSAAVTAYLGAKKRKTSAHATFLLHRVTSPGQPATAAQLKAATESVTIDDKHTETILRAHLKLTDNDWKQVDTALILDAARAVAIGLADEIAEFQPPPGVQLYNI